MKDSDPGRCSELTDTQLDQLLAETNRELLENVEATSDPSRTLTTIMSRNARQARTSRAGPGEFLLRALGAIMMSRTRARASTVTRELRRFLTGALSGRALRIGCAAAAAALIVLIVLAVRHVGGQAVLKAVVLLMPPIVVVLVSLVTVIDVKVRQRTGHDHDPGQALAAIMRSRIRARAVARILADAYHLGRDRDRDRGRELNRALARARDSVRELNRDLNRTIDYGRARDRDRALAEKLRYDLDHAIDLDRKLDRTREQADDSARQLRALDLDDELQRFLADARHNALALARALDERQVDVSGADLSRMDIKPDLLNGAIWTPQTSWPPGVASQVRTHSAEIRPDVYQVRLGSSALDLGFLALN